jgi:3-methyladenine DNA glycosylase AlkD
MSAKRELHKLKNHEYAEQVQRFFKTRKGEYGEGDLFLGVRMPAIRLIAKGHKELALVDIDLLIKSKWHEERLLGLIILVNQYIKFSKNKSTKSKATEIFNYYITIFEYVNNWDLVDSSCHKIIGPELLLNSKKMLHTWAKSNHIWTRRISMMTTLYFIRRGQYIDALIIAKTLINDKEDLIQKVVGWMLREVGNMDKSVEDEFLKKNYHNMPRTMLRYAIEKYPKDERRKILDGSY